MGMTARATAKEIQSALSNHTLYLSDMSYHSQYDPHCLQYMLEFFRHVAQTIPTDPPSPSTEGNQPEAVPIEPVQGSSAKDMLQDRAGIIVLREDLDYYVIPPRRDIEHAEMIEVKRAAGRALRQQNGIFSGLRKSEEPGTTEQHLIEMLTAGYAHREPLKLCWICANVLIVASITTILGDIAPTSRTKQSFAV
jgi:ATP-binding cassette subfamily F protein 3